MHIYAVIYIYFYLSLFPAYVRSRFASGNVKKDSLVGPRYIDWDSSLTRNFGITEHTNLQFRAEYFNLLNHTNLDDLNTTQSSANFGRITSDISPRIAQLSLKLLF